MKDRQENELNAITLYTRQCSIPLIEESDSDAEILGICTPFTVNLQHYLVTAAHILEDLIARQQLERVGIRLGESSAAVSNLGKCYIETFTTSDPFDGAVIRLEQPELISALRKGWRFLSPRDLSPVRADMPNCFVAGYPRATTRKLGWAFSAKFFCFVTSLLDQVPEEASDVREGLDIFLRHKESAEELGRGTKPVPNLKGVSGAAIWGIIPGAPDRIWSAESRLRVLGIQTHCRSGSY
jgi:trypsin